MIRLVNNKRLSYVIVFLLGGVHVALLLLFLIRLRLFSPTTILIDFDAYMRLLLAIREGHDPYTVSFMQTAGPPLVFSYYLPFSFLPLGIARVMHTLSQIFCIYLTLWIVVRSLWVKNRIIPWLFLSAIALSSFPVRFSLQMGQNGIFLAFCVSALIYTKQEKLQGLATGLLSIAKTIFIFPLGIVLLFKQKVLLYAGFTTVVVIGLSSIWIPISTYSTYFQSTFSGIVFSQHQPLGNDYYNQSLRSSLYRMGIDEYYVPILVTMVVVSLALCLKTRDIRIAILTSLLLSPVSWQHYYVVLIPIICSMCFPLQKRTIGLGIIFLALWWKDWPLFHTVTLNLGTGVLASHFFLCGLFVWGYLLWEKCYSSSRKSSSVYHISSTL